MGKDITITSTEGSFSAYLAEPGSTPAGVVVVIQEIFGVNPFVRGLCDDIAAKGFFALAPDLFWRMEPGVQLDPTVEEQFQKAFGFFEKYNPEDGVKDLQATYEAARKLPGANGKVGNMGFCLGGLLSYLSATRTDADASVGYYGVGIDGKLDELANATKPLMLHIAGADDFCPPAAQEVISKAAAEKDGFEVFIYDGAPHGFCRFTDAGHYHEDYTKLAHQRTFDFFAKNLD